MKKEKQKDLGTTRRDFLVAAGLGSLALGIGAKRMEAAEVTENKQEVIQGFDDTQTSTDTSKKWVQTHDRKIRVGIAGFGVCKFGAAFGFQDHPNVEIVAVTDLFPDRCAGLAQACRCDKMYPSLEEMVKDDKIEAVFVATDAPSHARHCLEVLKHGKHVCTACPAAFGSVEDAEQVLAAVKQTGLNYMMLETTT
ncbi:MAG TPA: Gfo/Idh/MocA family oxidoreductase, partial [bacterium]|nr:Gfo/Idh/MocA family oxidoreductase [bacterium]